MAQSEAPAKPETGTTRRPGPFSRSRYPLHGQILLFFILQMVVVFAGVGVYIDWRMRSVLEDELGGKLMLIARMAARQAENTRAVHLQPGDDSTRTMNRLREKLAFFTKDARDVARVMLLSPALKVIYDSAGNLRLGDDYVRLRFDRVELQQLFESGAPVTSKLFYDSERRPFKAAYAPVRIDDNPAGAVVCIEGSAHGLAAVTEVRRMLISIAVLALLLTILLAGVLARRITRPLEILSLAARDTGRGEFNTPLPGRGSREIVSLAETIADMRRAIEQRQRQQQMMLAGIAHEIRNPLGGIELFAGLLQKKNLPDGGSEVEKIRREVRHLKQIVTDFLDYARPVQAEPRAVAITGVVEDVLSLMAEELNGVRLQREHLGEAIAYADPQHVRQMLMNLLHNAIDAARASAAPVVTLQTEQAGSEVRVIIRDNGPGIAKEQQQHIFEPFYTTKSEGTGLGLALVQLLAQANGGRVELEAGGDQGATFVLTLPAG